MWQPNAKYNWCDAFKEEHGNLGDALLLDHFRQLAIFLQGYTGRHTKIPSVKQQQWGLGDVSGAQDALLSHWVASPLLVSLAKKYQYL